MQKLNKKKIVSIDKIIELKSINYNIDANIQLKNINHDFSFKVMLFQKKLLIIR